VTEKALHLGQIEKLLASHSLHGSESLCKLLRYLANHSLEHPGASPKEYQIATEVFGRPRDFDPQHDSTIRVQAGRLRLKLAEYYSTEGAADTLVVEMPKGTYVVSFHDRVAPLAKPLLSPSSDLDTKADVKPGPGRPGWPAATMVLSVLLAFALAAIALLLANGAAQKHQPTSERVAALDAIVPKAHRVDRLITDDTGAAQRFLDATLDAGHEGVMAKSLTAPYEAGRRGAGWLKVKPVHTLDLVVLGVEWGSGRRTGKLSNIHLGARDPATGGFVMLGKTFKGMTDAMLEWQTTRFMELAKGAAQAATSDISPTHRRIVNLRPEQVVEIAFDGVQGSSRYPGGMALRFARVLRYRNDKGPADADTIDTVRALYEHRA